MSTELEDVTTEHVNAYETASNTTNIVTDYTSKIAPFFDSTYQLAITIEFYFQYAILIYFVYFEK